MTPFIAGDQGSQFAAHVGDANNGQAARVDAAKAAAPYLHPKLAVQEVEHAPARPVTYIFEGMPMPKPLGRHAEADPNGGT